MVLRSYAERGAVFRTVRTSCSGDLNRCADVARYAPRGRRRITPLQRHQPAGKNEADEITREVLIALRRTFITPLDRCDFKDLITSMDDAIDQMNKTAKVIALFELTHFEKPMQQMGEIIVRAAKLSMEAVPLLESIGTQNARLNALTEELIRIEERSDQLHDQGRKELYAKRSEAFAFLIGTEVYDHLEKVVDRFQDVANEISAIVIENV
jgi:uncharacterized protein